MDSTNAYLSSLRNGFYDELNNILQETGVDKCDLQRIINLYWDQIITVQVNEVLTNFIKVSRGFRQLSTVRKLEYFSHLLK